MDEQYHKRTRMTQIRPESGNTHRTTHKTPRKYQTRKRKAMIGYMDSGSRNSPPFTTDKL